MMINKKKTFKAMTIGTTMVLNQFLTIAPMVPTVLEETALEVLDLFLNIILYITHSIFSFNYISYPIN
jgi:hypothetical protein